MPATSALPRQSSAPTLLRPPAPPTRVRTGPIGARAAARLAGRFRGDLATSQWWWSPGIHALHGVRAGSGQPTPAQLLARVHTDDRPCLLEAFGTAVTASTPFAQEYRVLQADGRYRTALLVCEPETDPAGGTSALTGLVVDLTEHRAPEDVDDRVRRLETEVAQLRTAMASRAAIEQAKGILMLLMGCGDQVAFDLLAHISSHTHRKVRDVAVLLVDSAAGQGELPADVREILHDACPSSLATG